MWFWVIGHVVLGRCPVYASRVLPSIDGVIRMTLTAISLPIELRNLKDYLSDQAFQPGQRSPLNLGGVQVVAHLTRDATRARRALSLFCAQCVWARRSAMML